MQVVCLTTPLRAGILLFAAKPGFGLRYEFGTTSRGAFFLVVFFLVFFVSLVEQ